MNSYELVFNIGLQKQWFALPKGYTRAIQKDLELNHSPIHHEKNVCRTHHCVKCCYGTEMPLLDADVKRIEGLGFEESYFATSSDGFKILKNDSSGQMRLPQWKAVHNLRKQTRGMQA